MFYETGFQLFLFLTFASVTFCSSRPTHASDWQFEYASRLNPVINVSDNDSTYTISAARPDVQAHSELESTDTNNVEGETSCSISVTYRCYFAYYGDDPPTDLHADVTLDASCVGYGSDDFQGRYYCSSDAEIEASFYPQTSNNLDVNPSASANENGNDSYSWSDADFFPPSLTQQGTTSEYYFDCPVSAHSDVQNRDRDDTTGFATGHGYADFTGISSY